MNKFKAVDNFAFVILTYKKDMASKVIPKAMYGIPTKKKICSSLDGNTRLTQYVISVQRNSTLSHSQFIKHNIKVDVNIFPNLI